MSSENHMLEITFCSLDAPKVAAPGSLFGSFSSLCRNQNSIISQTIECLDFLLASQQSSTDCLLLARTLDSNAIRLHYSEALNKTDRNFGKKSTFSSFSLFNREDRFSVIADQFLCKANAFVFNLRILRTRETHFSSIGHRSG